MSVNTETATPPVPDEGRPVLPKPEEVALAVVLAWHSDRPWFDAFVAALAGDGIGETHGLEGAGLGLYHALLDHTAIPLHQEDAA